MQKTAGLERTQFNLHDQRPDERFAYWKDSISCIFSVDAPRLLRRDNFHAELDAYLMAGLFVCRTRSQYQSWQRTYREISRDGMDHLMVQVFTSGQTRPVDPAEGDVVPEGGVIVFDLSREAHTITNNFENVSLVIPRSSIAPLLVDCDGHHLRNLPVDHPLTIVLRDHILNLYEQAPFMSQADAVGMEGPTLHLVAACLNAQVEEVAERSMGSAAQISGDLAQFFAAKQVILDRISDPDLDVSALSVATGVNRNKLYDLFQEQGGVANYIRDLRLKTVARQLRSATGQAERISTLAYEAGFRNVTSFNRQFRGTFGLSPSDYREASRTEGQAAKLTPMSQLSRYGRWLHDL